MLLKCLSKHKSNHAPNKHAGSQVPARVPTCDSGRGGQRPRPPPIQPLLGTSEATPGGPRVLAGGGARQPGRDAAPRRACPFLSSSGPGRSSRRGAFLRGPISIGVHPGFPAVVVAACPRRRDGGATVAPPRAHFWIDGPGAHFAGGGGELVEDWRPVGGGRGGED